MDFSRLEDIPQALELFGQEEEQNIVRPGLIRVLQHHTRQNTGTVHQLTGIRLNRFQIHDFLLSLGPVAAPYPGDIQ
ncbi:hypothetical protein D3C81_2257830 [compost metagenome]